MRNLDSRKKTRLLEGLYVLFGKELYFRRFVSYKLKFQLNIGQVLFAAWLAKLGMSLNPSLLPSLAYFPATSSPGPFPFTTHFFKGKALGTRLIFRKVCRTKPYLIISPKPEIRKRLNFPSHELLFFHKKIKITRSPMRSSCQQ